MVEQSESIPREARGASFPLHARCRTGRNRISSYAREDLCRGCSRSRRDWKRPGSLHLVPHRTGSRPATTTTARLQRNIARCLHSDPGRSPQNTERRHEGYFRREWSYALDRARNMADGALFILPVALDGVSAVRRDRARALSKRCTPLRSRVAKATPAVCAAPRRADEAAPRATADPQGGGAATPSALAAAVDADNPRLGLSLHRTDLRVSSPAATRKWPSSPGACRGSFSRCCSANRGSARRRFRAPGSSRSCASRSPPSAVPSHRRRARYAGARRADRRRDPRAPPSASWKKRTHAGVSASGRSRCGSWRIIADDAPRDAAGAKLLPLLIFDQFEELFDAGADR